MPLFKRRPKNEIPPVESDVSLTSTRAGSSAPPPYSSLDHSDSKELDLSDNGASSYTNSYSPAEHSMDTERRALFGAAATATDRPRYNQFRGGDVPHSHGGTEAEGGDQDVEGIKMQIRDEKNSTLETTNRLRQIAEDAQKVATDTLVKLGNQSESLANTERHLDLAKGHTARAEDGVQELKQLNRSIFIPVITFNKDKKRKAQEDKLRARYDEERNDREQAMLDIRGTHSRMGARGDDDDSILTSKSGKARAADRSRYQFESTQSDDELEDNIDSNLDAIESAVKGLKLSAVTMNTEIDVQNSRLDRMATKTDSLDWKVKSGTAALRKIK